MNISNSNYITKLLVQVTWDISGNVPAILLENLSSGPNLAGCSWFFEAYAPGEIPIHVGTAQSPDIVGNWNSYSLNDSWPRAFNNILFSGAPYQFIAGVIDGDGNIYQSPVQNGNICRPPGNTPKNSTNTYGLATVLVEVKCADGRVFFQDTTNATYQGLTGTLGSSVLRVIYPVDQTGNIPAAFVADHFSTALVPITYSSDNYQYQSSCIYDYDFGDYVHIRIKYQSFNPINGSPAVRFPVLCNINLCALFCEVDKLVQSIIDGSCANAQEANQKLNKINPLLWMITMGIQQPLCGIDVPGLIEEVKLIGGFECDCCNAPTGIIPTNSSIIDGYNFQVVSVCGDIQGTVVKNGNNIQIELQDITYEFAICDNSPSDTSAFQFYKNVTDCVAHVCLKVDATQLSFDILNEIKSNATLVNLFNSIVIFPNPGEWKLVVDGECIFSSAASYNYSFALTGIPANTTFAVLETIQIGATVVNLNFAFNMTTLAAVQAYLNGLGYGTFVVASTGVNSISITSVNNSTNINYLTYSPDGVTDAYAAMTKSASGFTPLSANQVVQAIITYLCTLTDAKVKTSEDYTICYIDPSDGQSKTEVIASGETLVTFFTALLARGCQTIEYISVLSGNTCASMKALFPSSEQTMQANDYFLGTKNGECARILPTEALLRQLQLGINDVDVMIAFCAMVNLCRGEAVCTPFSVFNAEMVIYDAECPMVVAVKAAPSDAGIDVYFAKFANTPTSNQFVTVQIYPHVEPGWVTVDGSVEVGTDGTFLATVNPTVVSGQVYDIRVANNCDSPLVYAYIYNVVAG